jgi:hypothetical protein
VGFCLGKISGLGWEEKAHSWLMMWPRDKCLAHLDFSPQLYVSFKFQFIPHKLFRISVIFGNSN